jgi:hypothetical protein
MMKLVVVLVLLFAATVSAFVLQPRVMSSLQKPRYMKRARPPVADCRMSTGPAQDTSSISSSRSSTLDLSALDNPDSVDLATFRDSLALYDKIMACEVCAVRQHRFTCTTTVVSYRCLGARSLMCMMQHWLLERRNMLPLQPC